ncbi:hypothetical protein TSUD_178740 [Trifolium subterraneum]|uniref:Reverse transcriptase Ty1/copia-type domain-containing protein n=1 Tax=Trifolium subterraneum TaxID=3900 RepID=A0A2Z6NME7_TRISU|nr:hypothetical protein TSUD_178740 [Trifolium subterraneum]
MQRRVTTESKLKDLKVKNYLFQSIDRTILETILNRETSCDIWEAMRRIYQGSTKVKRAQLRSLCREFEVLAMGESETVNECFARTLSIANRMTTQCERMEETLVVEKILRSMPPRFNYVVCSIEEANDVTLLTIDGLQSSLLVHEGRMKNQKDQSDEQALKIAAGGRGTGRGRGRNTTRGRSRGRGRGGISKEQVQCYKCHKLGFEKQLVKCGQLQQKNLPIVFKNDMCQVIHNEKGLIFTTQITANRMYIVFASVVLPKCLQVRGVDESHLWHHRYAHLNIKGLKILSKNNMVKGLLELKDIEGQCGDCLAGKQHRDNFPKKSSWRASQKLELVHSDICGLITPGSNAGNIKKLDGKSITCVLLGVSEESKAYKLYNPVEKRIIVSRDVVFEEKKGWNWDKKMTSVSNDQAIDFEESNDREIENETVNAGNNTPAQDEENHQDGNEVVEESDYDSDNDGQQSRVRRPPSYLRDYVTNLDDKEAGNVAQETDDVIQNYALFSSNGDPTTYEEASKHEIWRKAMESEMDSIKSNDTWELTDIPQGIKPIGVKWIYKAKINEEGVCSSSHMGYHKDYTFHSSFKVIECLQLDVKSAFLHGELTEDVYVEQPLGFHSGEKNQVYKLKKALYGLKQVPRAWYSKIESYFSVEKFMKCPHEHTLFVKHGVNQTQQGIFIHQHKYAYEILNRFGIVDCNKASSPIVHGCKLVKDEKGKAENATHYKQMIGSLMYLLATRPDLTYSVCLATRYMERPTEMHYATVKRILGYVKGTLNYGICYKVNNEDKLNLIGWTDSDYAGDYDDWKSTSGYVFTIGTGAISWSSKKQPIVTISTTKAEFVSASACACQGIWLRSILNQLNQTKDNVTIIYCDNSSSIKLAKNPIMHGRSKHIDVRSHFLGDLNNEGVIELKHCRTNEQLADIMTKALKIESFCKLREGLGVCEYN